jgi:YidC/Oxa1 family membrane protein insertase
MEKRTVLAVVLSLLVLAGWSAFVSKFYHVDNQAVTERTPSSIMPVSVPASTPTILSQGNKPEAPVSLLNLSLDKYEIGFNEYLGAIRQVAFREYPSSRLNLGYGFLLGDKTMVFNKESSSDNSITFVYRDETKEIKKQFVFSKTNYNLELDVEIKNLTGTTINNLNFPLALTLVDFVQAGESARFEDFAVALKEKVLHFNGRKDAAFDEIQFLAFRDKYFCAIIEPASGGCGGYIKKLDSKTSEFGLNFKVVNIGPGQALKEKFYIYLGPQDLQLMSKIRQNWTLAVNYGTFDFISRLLLQLLEFLNKIVHNWGIAIVLLSVLIYLALFPLSLKQMHAMKKMQVLQPHIEELRKTYKDNPQKLNKEIMELYKGNKVNPLSGCLPMVLQMPIFFALYQALMRSIALKGAKFLWIKDLSEPDRLFRLPMSLPIVGNEVNILPILMTIGMFFQQKMSMKTTAGGSAEQQKLMLIIFPLMFGFIFYRMPSGLVLYWFINSSLMLFNQFKISQAK